MFFRNEFMRCDGKYIIFFMLVALAAYVFDIFCVLVFSGAFSILGVLYKVRKFPPLFLMFIFFSMYLMPVLKYFESGVIFSAYSDFFQEKYVYKVYLMNVLFIGILGVGLNNISSKDFFVDIKANSFIFYSMLLICFLGVLSSLGSGLGAMGYEELMRGKTPLYEYLLIPFAISMIYRQHSLLHNVLLVIFIALYSIVALSKGGRVEIIQIVIVYFLLNTLILSKYSWKTIISLTIIGYIGLEFWGLYRFSYDLAFGDLINQFSSEIFSSIHVPVEVSHHGDVNYASMRIIGLKDEGYVHVFNGLLSGLLYPFSMILPAHFLPLEYDMARYKTGLFPVGGGGLMPAYFYAWFGWLGVIGSATALFLLINRFISSKNSYCVFYVILVLSTFPRWYSYTPIGLVKFCAIGVLGLLIVERVANKIKYQKK